MASPLTVPPAPRFQRTRHRALPHLTMPAPRERTWGGLAVSSAAHLVLVLLLVAPVVFGAATAIVPREQGAGGAGPVGGGGGGRRGTGAPERLDYVRVARAPAPAAAAVAPPVPVPAPVVPPPVAPVTPVPRAVTPPAATAPPAPAATTAVADAAPTTGTGGGTGSDGSAGSGPGSGGGVGSGVGTGRGSGTGPGTGGGTQANFPPTPLVVTLLPQPAPARVRGTQIIAEFDVDSTGRVLEWTFTETRDGGYNRKLRETFREIRFRPGTRPDGTPVRMKVQITYTP